MFNTNFKSYFTKEKRRNRIEVRECFKSVGGNLVQSYTIPIEVNYELTKKVLGKGSSGEVIIGKQYNNSRQYAIKRIEIGSENNSSWRHDREINIMRDIDHTNIIRLFEVYRSSTHLFFVMELCSGGHLGQVLRQQEDEILAEATTKSYILQLLSAVLHCHKHGICHRDIKLQNVLLESDATDAQVKLIDFGNAIRFTDATPLTKVVGTTYTTAPEVFKQNYDEKCDLWSIGVVTYILLSGRRPFESLEIPTKAKKESGVIAGILMGRYHFNHEEWDYCSQESIQFIQDCLEMNYLQRKTAKQLVEHEWFFTDIQSTQKQNFISRESSHEFINVVPVDDEMALDLSVNMGKMSGKRLSEDSIETFQKALKRHYSTSSLLQSSKHEKETNKKSSGFLERFLNFRREKTVIIPQRSTKIEILDDLSAHSFKHSSAGPGSVGDSSVESGETPVNNNTRSFSSPPNPNTQNHSLSAGLGQTSMLAVAFSMPSVKVKRLRAIFQEIDSDGSGSLEKDEFIVAMKQVLPDLTEADVILLFEMMDQDSNKSISFIEFLAATVDPREVDIQEINQAFSLLDKDQKGYITKEDLLRVLTTTNESSNNANHKKSSNNILSRPSFKKSEKNLNKSNEIVYSRKKSDTRRLRKIHERISKIIDHADVNQDGVVSYTEFLFAMAEQQIADSSAVSLPNDRVIDPSINKLRQQREALSQAPAIHLHDAKPSGFWKYLPGFSGFGRNQEKESKNSPIGKPHTNRKTSIIKTNNFSGDLNKTSRTYSRSENMHYYRIRKRSRRRFPQKRGNFQKYNKKKYPIMKEKEKKSNKTNLKSKIRNFWGFLKTENNENVRKNSINNKHENSYLSPIDEEMGSISLKSGLIKDSPTATDALNSSNNNLKAKTFSPNTIPARINSGKFRAVDSVQYALQTAIKSERENYETILTHSQHPSQHQLEVEELENSESEWQNSAIPDFREYRYDDSSNKEQKNNSLSNNSCDDDQSIVSSERMKGKLSGKSSRKEGLITRIKKKKSVAVEGEEELKYQKQGFKDIDIVNTKVHNNQNVSSSSIFA